MSDNLTPDQRRHCMSRVRNRDTDLETSVRSQLHRKGLRFRKHLKTLPGTPDIAFIGAKVAVFLNGDFWHGYQFGKLKNRLAPFWQEKIAKNRNRDAGNYLKLRKMGWKVIRLWKHQIKKDINNCVERISMTVRSR